MENKSTTFDISYNSSCNLSSSSYNIEQLYFLEKQIQPESNMKGLDDVEVSDGIKESGDVKGLDDVEGSNDTDNIEGSDDVEGSNDTDNIEGSDDVEGSNDTDDIGGSDDIGSGTIDNIERSDDTDGLDDTEGNDDNIEQLELKQGMIFDTWEIAETYLEDFAKYKGFCFRKRRCIMDPIDKTVVRKRTFECSQARIHKPEKVILEKQKG